LQGGIPHCLIPLSVVIAASGFLLLRDQQQRMLARRSSYPERQDPVLDEARDRKTISSALRYWLLTMKLRENEVGLACLGLLVFFLSFLVLYGSGNCRACQPLFLSIAAFLGGLSLSCSFLSFF
jgi:hypothetical protein